ncbi:hypothetical protein GLOIN_2v1600807 [Rhizophagus clarus]|uniref:Secreted protein n=1 Tax=Rhizophagus clarus TaxID=94130 RepID=A0A8H3LVJ6_9GLOM|nr:hypothetical protein GLOIN_2v1600807 [Rhizophagus clarus]
MWGRLLGASSFIAVVATNTSRVVHPQDRYHTKKEEQQPSNYHHNHYNNHPHYQFQYQLKQKYPAFSRYGQTVDIEHTNFTKKSKSKRSKPSKRNANKHL